MKKKNVVLISSIVLAVLLVVGGTMAWFTAKTDPVTNTFTAGTVDIELLENGVNTEGITIDNVNPGDTHNKVVTVQSLGSKKTYVRVKLTPVWTPATGKELPGTDIVTSYPIGADWIKGATEDDGGTWYYYKGVLEDEEGKRVTTALITEVAFAGKEMGNEYQGAAFTLTLKAEAIQASNGAIQDEWKVDPEDNFKPITTEP